MSIAAALVSFIASAGIGDDSREARYYRLVSIEAPKDLVVEVSGITIFRDEDAEEDGDPIVSTRRGEVFVIENAYGERDGPPVFHRFAQGLQEPLGLLQQGHWLYVQQRGELSRMNCMFVDKPMDSLETVCDAWQISGNYHEYAFGPTLDKDGNFWITLNRPFGDEPFGHMKWRGFACRITPSGEFQPMCCGLRSPCGIATAPMKSGGFDGELFYTDNQGEWCGTGKLSQLQPGDFHGHPWGIDSCKDPLWKFADPGQPPNEVLMPEVPKQIPTFRLPAVWFPYDKMGRSCSGFVWDETGGKFGPFAHQLFIGDQYQSSVIRVCLERINDHWQGACFPFRVGLSSGVVRVCWGKDGSLFCGETNRGWGSFGPKTDGLERLVWTGELPFEVLEMHAKPDGFELSFTAPVDPKTAGDPASYELSSYTYLLHETYGSAETDTKQLAVRTAVVAPDAKSVRLVIDGLRAGYVHEFHCKVTSAAGEPLLHDAAYYTLIEIPR